MEYNPPKIREKSIRNRKIFEKCAEEWEGGLVLSSDLLSGHFR
jgi:hypothetical protein